MKKQLPEAEIHFCTKASYHTILSENPNIDRFHLLGEDQKLSEMIDQLKSENFTHVIDLHNNLRTLRIKQSLKTAKSYSFPKLNREKWLLVNWKVNKMPNRHIVDRYMDTVRALGVDMDSSGLDYFIPERDRLEWDWLPKSHQKGFVAFAIGGQHGTKRMPVNKMIELCHQINRPIALIGASEDEKSGREVESFFNAETCADRAVFDALEKKTIIFNACGKCNLNQSAWLIQHSQAVFTHDTGMMHVAAAFRKKVFSIWGNTTPKFGMYPYRTRFTIFENNDLKCRPCSKLGFEKCPKGHFKCMNDLKFDFHLPEENG